MVLNPTEKPPKKRKNPEPLYRGLKIQSFKAILIKQKIKLLKL
tara:strand:+ start:932 stop:1060 length:129 start_codon:yes stop_codon:yes gene_type:complete